MPGFSTGTKSLLEITACSLDSSGQFSPDEDDKFEVMINPSGYKCEKNISYNKQESIGRVGKSLNYSQTMEDKVNFEIVIDGTGVVNLPVPGIGSDDVATQIESLNEVLGYDGSEHEPKYSRLVWGSFIFYGRMTTYTTSYTLFKPDGSPLRAKVSLAFSSSVSDQQEKLETNKTSPDLSHIVEIKAGDTLPQLCNKIYKDPSYYIDIAKVNRLDNFRQLKAGEKLLFPPLK
ncbi:MAG TPA: peptidoglycan-binding protein [Gammaproteobacteria bacterium]|nr:peptidoglycan-binding protein [Gammaproteobacteria bacterium]